MVQETALDRRRWPRQPVRLPARYFIKDCSTRFQDCTIINISRGGATVLLPGYEYFQNKGYFYLDFIVPKTVQQLSLRGQIRMKQNQRAGLLAGIQFDKLLPEPLFNRITETERLKGWLSGIHAHYGSTTPPGCTR